MMKDYQTFEGIIANLHSIFYPNASVTWNHKLVGKSGVKRQIDVFIEDNSYLYPIKIVIDCKHYKHKVDIKDVESTWMLVDDVRANLGIIICNSGYTEGAIKRAKDIGLLKLCLAIDCEHNVFSAKVAIPIVAIRGKLKYKVETTPKTVLATLCRVGQEEIFLEDKRALKKVTFNKFIIDYLKSKDSFSNTNFSGNIEISSKEWELFTKKSSKKYSKIIVSYMYTGKMVISSIPISEGKGVIEVRGTDREYIVGNPLIGSNIGYSFNYEEAYQWKWRDFDYNKDFPDLYFSSDQLEEILLEVEPFI